MSEDWKAGDVAMCVDDGPHPSEPHAHLLTRGRHYRVAVAGCRTIDGAPALGFRELSSRPGWAYGYRVERFRKLNDEPDDIALIERIKRPVSAPTRVDA